MNRVIPSQTFMKKYLQMGFDRHLIHEVWAGCQENEAIFLNTLLKIRSRDQLCSEQRLVWDGKRPPIKRIVNQTKLKKLAKTDILLRDARKEFQELRKKGLLLKKEYRGHRALDLEYDLQYGGLTIQYIQCKRDMREMKGHVRRLRHFSIKFDFYIEGISRDSRGITVPLLKSMKSNFVGLVSLKISLKKTFRFFTGTLQHFNKLFRRLGQTLKHLDLAFESVMDFEVNFPRFLGQIIMKNLQKLETLCLNFGDRHFSTSLVMFFINSVCSRLPSLKKLSLQMPNCFVDKKWFLPQTSFPNNLRCLVLNFDKCCNLTREYLLFLQHDIAAACPLLEELYIRLPNYNSFSGGFISDIEEKLLQKLNLKRLFIERSLKEALDCYENIRNKEMNEETTLEELFRRSMTRGLREEELGCFSEMLALDKEIHISDGYFEREDEQDELLSELEYDQIIKENTEFEEQEEAERVLRGYPTRKEELDAEVDMYEMWDWYEEEKLYYEI